MTHHSFGYTLPHDGEKSPRLSRAEMRERFGGYQDVKGWKDDFVTRYWRMRICNLWLNVALAAQSKVQT